MMFDAITAAQLAMQYDQLKLQSITQNVANMNTPGFKKQTLEQLGFDEQLQSQINSNMQMVQNSSIKNQGTLNQTHQLNDLALTGDGYFQVQNEQGIFYTRRGDFHVNKHGELTTATGETLLGKGGVIKVEDHHFTINKQGSVLIDSHQVDQLNVVQFNPQDTLRYVGNGLYQTDASPSPASVTTQVLQGFIEQSNVKSIDEMMDMVKTSRHFEANQRVMRAADNLLAAAISQLGEGNV